EGHVRAVLLGAAGGDDDGRLAGLDEVSKLGPGELLQERRIRAVRGCAGRRRQEQRREQRQQPSAHESPNVWTNRPLEGCGSNHVVLGGIMRPASETAMSCSMVVGNIEMASAASPESTRASSSRMPRPPPTKSIRLSVR